MLNPAPAFRARRRESKVEPDWQLNRVATEATPPAISPAIALSDNTLPTEKRCWRHAYARLVLMGSQ